MPKRYDNVRIISVVDGTTIEGHEAVEEHLEREQKLLEEHGSTITFQLYRANLAGSTRAEVQGKRLAELRIAGGQITGTDTVASVKQQILRELLGDHAAASHVTFVFGGRVMCDDALFYADHFMLLPSWVQVVLSEVPFPEVIAALTRLPT
jgi:hypothetical protein